mgnify:CR=1 FL=1|jgi:hypothetical protein|tara:strand:+ start:98 stop:286 length:189 start_codon:yes stop_codon:yes gene_type:complete
MDNYNINFMLENFSKTTNIEIDKVYYWNKKYKITNGHKQIGFFRPLLVGEYIAVLYEEIGKS